MRNILAFLALAALLIAGAGWYLGWYQMKSEPATDGHREITIDINGPKIGQDLDKGKARLRELLDSKKAAPAPTVSSAPTSGSSPSAGNAPSTPAPARTTTAPAAASGSKPTSVGARFGQETWSHPVDDASWVFPAEQESAPPLPPPPGPPAAPPAPVR
jgi:hypothetical protein